MPGVLRSLSSHSLFAVVPPRPTRCLTLLSGSLLRRSPAGLLVVLPYRYRGRPRRDGPARDHDMRRGTSSPATSGTPYLSDRTVCCAPPLALRRATCTVSGALLHSSFLRSSASFQHLAYHATGNVRLGVGNADLERTSASIGGKAGQRAGTGRHTTP